jgi:uncharacterized protein (DUF697 family)
MSVNKKKFPRLIRLEAVEAAPTVAERNDIQPGGPVPASAPVPAAVLAVNASSGPAVATASAASSGAGHRRPINIEETASGRVMDETPGSDAEGTSSGARHAAAAKWVERHSLWAGAAGIIPVPLIDLAAVSGVQLQMLRGISKIYGVPFSENRGKALIVSLAGSMIQASSSIGAVSLLKGVPVVGTAVSAVVMPALSAGATYAIGMVFVQHFRSGGTLLDFNPQDYRAYLKAQRQAWRARRGANAVKRAGSVKPAAP